MDTIHKASLHKHFFQSMQLFIFSLSSIISTNSSKAIKTKVHTLVQVNPILLRMQSLET